MITPRPSPRPGWRTPPRVGRGGRGEEGSSTVQAVLIFPALLFALMLVIQFALWAHATSVAEAAAQDAAAVARRADGSRAGGAAAANKALATLGPKMLTSRTVSVNRSATTASVTVTGRVVSLVPGVTLRVQETAEGPVERFVPLEQRP